MRGMGSVHDGYISKWEDAAVKGQLAVPPQTTASPRQADVMPSVFWGKCVVERAGKAWVRVGHWPCPAGPALMLLSARTPFF